MGDSGRADYPQHGQRRLRTLLSAQRARHIRNQGLDGEPTRCSPIALSSHPICHHEEDKRGREESRSGRWHGPMHDEEAIFVGPVLALEAWVLLRADVQGQDGPACPISKQQRV